MAHDTRKPLPLRIGALGRLKHLLESKRWREIGQCLDTSAVWAYDRPLSVDEFVDALKSLFTESDDLQLLVMALLKEEQCPDSIRASFTCCLMWGDPGTWEEHEIEFDLHLGYSGGEEGGWSISYLGITRATPENIPFPEGD